MTKIHQLTLFSMIFRVALLLLFVSVAISTKNVQPKYQRKLVKLDNHKILNKRVAVANKHNVTCFKPTLENFPKDLFSDEDRKNGVIALHVAIAVYLFSILAMLIQAYLMGAIKTIADKFRIATDSARNTITVVASLLPEFCCSLIGVFVSKGNIGAATVIGSCAANSLLTLGVVGLLISQPVKLSWYPLWRDNIFYLVTVTILLWTSYDHELRWQECLFLVSVYLVYLLIINFNHKVERGVRRIVFIYRTGDDEQEADQEIQKTPLLGRRKHFERRSSKPSALFEETIPEENSDDISGGEHLDDHLDVPRDPDTISIQTDGLPEHYNSREDRISLCTEDGYLSGGGYGYNSDGGYLSERGYHSEKGYGSINYNFDTKEGYASEGDYLLSGSPRGRDSHVTRFARHAQRVTTRMKRRLVQGSYFMTLDMDHYIDGPLSPFIVPEKWYMKILWALSIPAICIFHITIPDCRKPTWRSYYPLTILSCTIWVALLSYALVWIAVEIGYVWKVPDAVMGFAFLATGLSFSEIVSTYLQTQAGYGYKAVYSIYGSNVFNITINLGLVWLIKSAIHNPYELNNGSIIFVNLCQLIIVLTPLLLQFTRWRLNKILGVVYLILYCCFTTIVVLLEYDIIGEFNPPVCLD